MKIFVVLPQKYAGCGFYRQYQPHNHLAKQGIDVLIGNGLYNDDGFNVEADIIHFHKGYFDPKGMREAQKRGIKVIIDFDDWWRLDTEHLFYRQYIDDDVTAKLIEALKLADYVTVTTELLANEVRKINPNVCVLPNAMDMNYPSHQFERMNEGKLVFGYIGGHCHLKDVSMLNGLVNRLNGRGHFRLMGFDGSEVYRSYADILSDFGGAKNFDWVRKASIEDYHKMYSVMDVSLVPLVDNKFNSLKSELKLIEAGFFKKGVIVSNVEPYKGLLRHKENCFVVNKPADWVKGCKWYLDNPSALKETGEALYETVQPYSIENVNKKRLKFYQDVLKERDTNSSDRHSRLQGVHG